LPTRLLLANDRKKKFISPVLVLFSGLATDSSFERGRKIFR
jgi:hypothetical protein